MYARLPLACIYTPSTPSPIPRLPQVRPLPPLVWKSHSSLPDALTSGFVPSTPFAKKVKLSKTRELKKKLNLLVCLLINAFNMLTLLVILL